MSINILAVLVAGVASMVVGSFWYGPIFGKKWIKLMGFTKEDMESAKKKGMTKNYILGFVGSIVMAYVLSHFVGVWGAVGIAGAFSLAFWVWLGFYATTLINSVLWEGRPWQLYFLNISYHLVNLFVVSLILTLWL